MANRYDHAARIATKKQKQIDAGLISERFPNVAGIVLYMKYFRQGVNPLLMARTVNFSPEGYAFFHMECVTKGCNDGGFDLKKIITDMIKVRKKSHKGKLTCPGKSKELASDHASIEYEISISFYKKS